MRQVAALVVAGLALLQGAGTPSIDVRSVAAEQAPVVHILLRVQDSAGKPVAGLTAPDFDVFEDDKAVSDVAVRQSHPNDKPVAVAMLIDVSGSMSPADVAGAAAGTTAVLDRLTPDDQVEIVSFDSTVTVLAPFSTHVDRSVLTKLKPGTDTKLNDAVAQELDRIAPIQASARALIVLTDGADDGSKLSSTDLLAKATSAGVAIHTIGLGKVDAAPLQALADASKGSFQAAAAPQDLAPLYATIASSLLTEYHLSYTSAAAKGEHTLTIVARTSAGDASAHEQFRLGVSTAGRKSSSTLPLLLATLLLLGGVVGVFLLVRASRRGERTAQAGTTDGSSSLHHGISPADPAVWQQASTSLHLFGEMGMFPVSGPTTIGRDPRADIVVDDDTVSRSHARLQEHEGALFIEDLGSANGTTVNGAPITTYLAVPGDVVSFGDLIFEVRAPT